MLSQFFSKQSLVPLCGRARKNMQNHIRQGGIHLHRTQGELNFLYNTFKAEICLFCEAF